MPKITTPAMKKAKKMAAKRPLKTGFWHESWYRLRRNKIAIVGMVILIILIILALFPETFAPYGEDEQNYSVSLTFPNKDYPLGTDNYGRDILSRLIYGTQVSLKIGFLSMSISLMIGGFLGLFAAYYGDRIEDLIMRIMDILYSLPSFLMAIAIAAALGTGEFNLILAIAISYVPQYSRIVRASALTVKSQEFMEAAYAIGASPLRQMFKHMLPNALAPIIVKATLGVAQAILAAAALSFVGVGIRPPTAEWGVMLSAGRSYIRTHWYIVTFPGLMIMITIFALNLLGDGFRDAMDPKLKR